MRRNKTNIALSPPFERTKKAKENRRLALNGSNANKNNSIDFYMDGWVHLAGAAAVASVALVTMENWNDDKSNFIKYRYTSPKKRKQKVCPVYTLSVIRLFIRTFIHSFVRSVEISVGIHLLQQIECGCNHTYHTTKFLFMVSSCCLSAAMCQFKYYTYVQYKHARLNAYMHAHRKWCVQS